MTLRKRQEGLAHGRCFAPNRSPGRFAVRMCLVLAVALAATVPAAASTGRLSLTVTDRETGEPIACRMHLKNDRGRMVRPRRACAWADHFLLDGQAELVFPLGQYSFELERGPEYAQMTGHFVLNRFADDAKTVSLRRFVDMAGEGWYSGDLSVRRPPVEAELILRAEDLHLMPIQTWWDGQRAPAIPADNPIEVGQSRIASLYAGKISTDAGSLLFLNLPEQPTPEETKADSLLEVARRFRNRSDSVWIDVPRPYCADLPVLVASDLVDSVQIAHGNMGREKSIATEREGLQRDTRRYPGVWGNARWTQQIYFHLLNCGLRIPPSAGSDSGMSPNPPGYNRMYVHLDEPFSYRRWWEAFRRGRVMVTNGPLLRPVVEGELPGHVFREPAETTLELEIGLTVSTRDPISYLDIIKNGEVISSVRFEDYASTGKLPTVTFDSSGWFVLRATTDVTDTYRFAMTAPYYVEMGSEPAIHRSSVQFFLDWIDRRIDELGDDEAAAYREARRFWSDLLQQANAE